MAYDEDLAERVRVVLAGEVVDERRMFGGLAFLVGGHLSVAVSGVGGLMVRTGPEQTARLLEQPGVEPVVMGGRGAMKGWVRVRPEVVADDEALRGWVARGLESARALEP